MSILRFRVYWEEDELVYRDIEILTEHTFADFNQAIIAAYALDTKQEASFFESDRFWNRKREFSSEVLLNKKEAPALSMIKTPVVALVADRDQRFVYEYNRQKKWVFLVELIGLDKEKNEDKTYPRCSLKEGLSPALLGTKDFVNTHAMETTELYSKDEDEMGDGFGDEGEGENEDSHEEQGNDFVDDF